MATFISRSRQTRLQLLLNADLDATFPQHEFLAGDPDASGFENSILAVHGSAGSGDLPGEIILPNPAQVSEVKMAFRQILEDLKGWKPS